MKAETKCESVGTIFFSSVWLCSYWTKRKCGERELNYCCGWNQSAQDSSITSCVCSPLAGLPEHEVWQPRLPRGPDEEVRGGGVPGVELPLQHRLVHLLLPDLAPGQPDCQLPRGVGDLLPGSVGVWQLGWRLSDSLPGSVGERDVEQGLAVGLRHPLDLSDSLPKVGGEVAQVSEDTNPDTRLQCKYYLIFRNDFYKGWWQS